jgi:hypothetical protein
LVAAATDLFTAASHAGSSWSASLCTLLEILALIPCKFSDETFAVSARSRIEDMKKIMKDL